MVPPTTLLVLGLKVGCNVLGKQFTRDHREHREGGEAVARNRGAIPCATASAGRTRLRAGPEHRYDEIVQCRLDKQAGQ